MSVRKNVIENLTNIRVSSNEYLVKYTFWRNFRKLLENDTKLHQFLLDISGGITDVIYQNGQSYDFGDIVWFFDEEEEIAVLLKSMVDGNTNSPRSGGNDYSENGWQASSKDVDIYSTNVMEKLERLVALNVKQHQDNRHPYGVQTKSTIKNILAYADVSNINPNRASFFFPYTTGFLQEDNVILNGFYRYYDNGLLEYDIIYRLGYVGNTTVDGMEYDALTCNNLILHDTNENNRYFYNYDAYRIFNHENTSKFNKSYIGDATNLNRNDFVNVYSAEINLPVAFLNTQYMIFSGNVLSQNQDTTKKNITTGANTITFCNKGKKSLTAILVTYPQGNWSKTGYNATNGGLVANSFRCKLIGRAKSRNE